MALIGIGDGQKRKGKVPDGMILSDSGNLYKPEECGVDGNGNGWCAGESVDPKLFMQPEPKPQPKPKPAPKPKPKPASPVAAPVKKKNKKKDKDKDKITGKIQAVKVLKKKGDSQRDLPTRVSIL